MIKFTLQALEKLGFQDDQIVTILEKRMKCGVAYAAAAISSEAMCALTVPFSPESSSNNCQTIGCGLPLNCGGLDHRAF